MARSSGRQDSREMTGRVLHLVEAGVETPDRETLSECADLEVETAATRAAALERATEGPIACVVGEASDPDWLLDAVAAVRERAGAVPVVVRSAAHHPELAVACDEHRDVTYFPRGDERAVDVSLLDRVRATVSEAVPARRRRALERLQAAVTDGDAPVENAARSVLSTGLDYLGVDVGFLSTIDRATGQFEVVAASGDHDRLQDGATSPLATTYCRRAIDRDRPLAVHDAAAQGWEGDPAYEQYGLGCYLGAPVTVDGELYGTLCFADADARPRGFTDAEAAFLELAASWLGTAIERTGDRPGADAGRVLDRISDAFFAVDQAWTVTYVNERFEEVVGVGAEELLGENLWESFPDAVERDFYDEYHRAMATQEPVAFEEYFPPMETWFSVRAYPSPTGLSVYFRDVTDRREQERTLSDREDVLEEMHRVVAEKGVPVAEKVDWLLRIGREALDTEFAALSRVEGDDLVFEQVHDPTGETQPGDVAPLAETYCARAVLTEETLVLADIAADAPDLAERTGIVEGDISCYLGTPVVVDGEDMGTFCFYDREARSEGFSDWQVTLVELMGNWVSQARERTRRRRELERYETILETLQAPVYAVDADSRFTLVTDPLADQLGVDRETLLGEPLARVLDEATYAECRSGIEAAGPDVDLSIDGRAVTDAGDRYPAAVELTGLPAEDGFAGAVGTIEDVTERRERARDLEFYYELVEAAGIAIAAVDERGRLAYANPAFADLGTMPSTDLTGTPVWELSEATSPETFAEQWRSLDLGDTATFELAEGSIDVEVNATKAEIEATPYLFGTAVDVTRRRDRERAFATLQETAGDLLEAETTDEVATHTVAAATDIIDAPYVSVYGFDRDAGVLEPVAVSEDTEAVLESLPTYSGGDGLLWQAFVRGEPRTYADVTDHGDVYDDDTPVRAAMLLPLGTHGVLAVGDDDPGAFSDEVEEFTRTLAANTEVALDRATGREELRRNERALTERTERLEQLDRINTVIRRTAGAVVEASTREEVERVVCDRFADGGHAEFAWVGRPDPANETVTPSEWVGEPGQPATDAAPIDDGPNAHPVGAAVATGDVVVRSELLADAPGAPPAWRRQALAHGYQSCCAVPFDYEGVTRGVLMLYADEPDAFGEDARPVLAELGTVLGHVLASVERRGARSSAGVTEVEFDVGDTDVPCALFADALDCRVTFKRVEDPAGDAPAVTYGLAGAPDDAVAVLEGLPGVEGVRSVAVDDEEVLVEVTLAGGWVGGPVAEAGGEVAAATAGDGEGTLTVRLPTGVDVRGVVESVRTAQPGATVTAQREREAPPAEPLELARRLDALLTDRQHAALETAYHSGYFDRPRRATGDDVASLLGVSQPTFSEHLQRAQGRTFGMLFDGEGLREE